MHQFVVTEGANASSILFVSTMIDKQIIEQTVNAALEGTDCFLVDVTVTPANTITVEIDSMEGVDIDTCAMLTRKIEAAVDRDVEDYELEVGSAGLTSPLRVYRQYLKNIGNEVEVLTRAGKKLQGVLSDVSADGSEITVVVKEKVKEPGKKRPVLVDTPMVMQVADTKYVKYLINFK